LVLVDESWTLQDLVAEAATRLADLPPPKNGQVRAVPDDRTVRYYAAIGLLDRPAAMRGRTALYGRRHLAQVVAIKRLQTTGHSLAELQTMWPTLDDHTLARMTGIAVGPKGRATRGEFWKREPVDRASGLGPRASDLKSDQPATPVTVIHSSPEARGPRPEAGPSPSPSFELRLELGPTATLVIAVPDDAAISLTPTDVRALRAAAAPLVSELARRGLAAHALGTLERP
jgi:DNA-binding transcriptional MerR regulator